MKSSSRWSGWWVAAVVACGSDAFAQTPLPTGGAQLQQIPPVPAPVRPAPTLRIVPADAAAEPGGGVRIHVDSLRISGNTLYTEAELRETAGFVAGAELTLGELRAMAARITERYRRDGYFLALAHVPAQDVADHVVALVVAEGRYGDIEIRNHSRLDDGLLRSDLEGLRSGDIVAIAPLESRLLLLSDIAGVVVTSTLVPGQLPGASDLVVDVVPRAAVTGSVDLDNAGNRYTGAWRVGATVNLNNAAGRGDVASLRVLSSGAGLGYARASYQMQFGRVTGGAAYSVLHYELGREFESLDAHGTAQIASLYGSMPLLRSRRSNVSVQLGFDAKSFADRVDATSSAVDKHSQVLTATLRGDHLDELGGGGASNGWLAASVGRLHIDTESVRAQDAATARTQGGFARLAFGASRVQNMTDTVTLYGALSGQLASSNLDIAEKMELGGINGVRAYPEGEAYADDGLLATLEARLALPRWSAVPGQWQAIAFVDAGSVATDHSPWAEGDHHRTLAGAGVGLVWAAFGDTVVRAYYARRIGSEPARSAPDASGRVWLQAVKYF